MRNFEVKNEFLMDGKPFKILSGAIHYFRVHPDDWYHSLYNLKALGFNTVETYVPWNMHEFKKGTFNFNGQLDIVRFLKLAESLNLYAIVRPTPFICAEWEFGGLPAWLLNEPNMKIRRYDEAFLNAVDRYFSQLLPLLAPLQYDRGGNILMFQIENEYGSYGQEKNYLRAINSLMKKYDLTMPFFTSDGPWLATMASGSLIEDDILATGNFGSKANENFDMMQQFFDTHHKQWPLMCMEFWDGWFNRWKEPIIKRDPEELAQAVLEVLKRGSINLYMFHGGTNFGFMNGCSARGRLDLPQITSYDYDALLNEQGNPTPKYFAVLKMMQQHFPQYETGQPLVKQTLSGCATLTNSVGIFDTLETLGQPIQSTYPMTMEQLGQNVGYTLYETTVDKHASTERFRVIDASDDMRFFINREFVTQQYQTEIGENIMVDLTHETNRVSVLVENMGRVNYGHKLLADTQRKGIRTGVCADLHFITNWQQYTFEWTTCPTIDFEKPHTPNQPAFYRYDITLATVEDTYLDMQLFGKGVVFVNGVNVGRYWNVGPVQSLFVPHGLLHEGNNTIVVFDLESKGQQQLNLVHNHVFTDV